jgi:ethanolaminephosphotransferase
MAYGSVGERIWKGSFRDLSPMAGFVFSFMIIMSSMTFKVNVAYVSMEYLPKFFQLAILANAEEPEKLISLARLSMFCVGIASLYDLSKLLTAERLSKFNLITNLSYLLEVLLITQSRVPNIPLFVLLNLLRNYLQDAITRYHRSSKEKAAILILFIIVLQHFTFFAFGGSNSLATVDLSNAYNGAGSYDLTLVGILTFVSNWAGPIYWGMAGLSMLMENPSLEPIGRATLLYIKTVITVLIFSTATLGILVSCWIQKHHLFIWSVFSPKFLYACAWVLFQQAAIDIGLASVLTAMAR